MLELCRSLDGLPLAIELAAARTRTLPVEEIARRLDDRFGVLHDPASRKPERRRALKATIGWSYELLFPDDQRGLWALAAFTGGAPLPAVEAVLEALDVPAPAAIDVVGRLAEPLARDRGRRPLPAARQHPRVRARRAGGGRADRACLRRARGVVRRRGRVIDRRACAARGRPSTSRSRGPSARTSTPPSRGAGRSRSPTGSAGRGSCSATAAARSACWRRWTTRRPRASAPPRCCSRAGSRRRAGTSSRRAGTSRPPRRWPATTTCARAATTTSPTSSRTTASGSTRSS